MSHLPQFSESTVPNTNETLDARYRLAWHEEDAEKKRRLFAADLEYEHRTLTRQAAISFARRVAMQEVILIPDEPQIVRGDN